jgi:DNA invertase Pin-like site-specific DNA recombinase
MKAWAFYRRSTKMQELSVDDQRQKCRVYAADHGWKIVREFEPNKGFGSGLTIDRDASFLEMIRLAELGGHGIRYLIVYDVSRFGRLAPEDKIYWEQRFKKQGGIQIVYVKDGFKNDGSIGDVLNKVVQHSGAHEYSRKLSDITLRGSKSRAELGHSVGGPAPYGYDRLLIDGSGNPLDVLKRGQRAAPGQHVIWTPSPSEAATVRLIFQQYDRGIGLKRLTEHLNANSIPPPSSTRAHRKTPLWCKSTIHAILKNRVYTGFRIYNQTNCKGYRRGEGGPFRKPTSEWSIKENAHEAIIARDLFDRIQATFRSRSFGSGRSYSRPYLLTSLAKCGHCGYNLTGSKHDNYRRYGCSGYDRIGTSVCRNYYLLADEVESLALDAIRTQIKSPKWSAEVKRTLDDMVKGEFQNPLAREIEELRRQLQETTRQIENVVQAIQKTGYSEALELSLHALEAQRNGVRDNLRELESKVRMMAEAGNAQDRVFKLVGEFDEMWKRASLDEKKLLLKDFLYGVTVDPATDPFKATYYVWSIPGMGKEIAPILHLSGEPGRLPVKYVAGAGLEPATYSL